MDTRIVETIAQMALDDYLALPGATPEAVEERRAAVEAAGLDWLATLRWLAQNRERIFALAKEAWDLIQTFPKPNSAASATTGAAAGPEAVDPVTIITLITTLAPMIEKLLTAIRNRRSPPQPQPQPGPGPNQGSAGVV